MKNLFHFLIKLIVMLVLITISSASVIEAQENKPVIVISPGHGWGNDGGENVAPGAVFGDMVEKDVNLEIAKYTSDYLRRCPVDVYLTRSGDDPDHTLFDVDEIVNAFNPTVAVSIHTNSDEGNPSGTEGWYTVGGFDDDQSQQLAASLADHIASRLQISNNGAKPETDNRHEGLYIHWWDAPSALVEVAYFQGDAELIRTRKDDFGRSIAQAILEYLDMDPLCADWAIPQGLFVATYFPGDKKTNEIRLRNDGLMEWKALDYFLVSQGNEFGADVQYPLFQNTLVNDVATWEIPAEAPSGAGVFRQEWQLVRGTEQIGRKITVYLVVVPQAASEIKEEVDQRIDELKQQGEQEIDEFINQLEQEAINWATEWAKGLLPDIGCGQQMLLIGFALGSIFIIRKRRD